MNTMTKSNKLPPHDSNGFYLPNGEPHSRGYYGLPTPPLEKQVETALAYLSQLKPTKQPTFSSYHLKHCAEHWGKRHGMEPYVSNGALIEAAIRLGLVIKPDNINAGIGVSKHDVEASKRQNGRPPSITRDCRLVCNRAAR